ncbi:putative diguanylate cyclase YeaP [compost metagenome]
MQIPEGLSVPWEDTLCRRALEESQTFSNDVDLRWGDSDAARALQIQTYLSTPVRLTDGALYGTLCAASSERHGLPSQARKMPP